MGSPLLSQFLVLSPRPKPAFVHGSLGGLVHYKRLLHSDEMLPESHLQQTVEALTHSHELLHIWRGHGLMPQ